MTSAALIEAIATTWPARSAQGIARFRVPPADPGGNRVSAARLSEPMRQEASDAEIMLAEAAMHQQGRPPLFQVFDHQSGLDQRLAARGYTARDATRIMTARCETVACEAPPVTVFETWPPLAIQSELWQAGGIDQARQDIMDRCDAPKTSLLGRIDDRPAGVAFIAIDDQIAMLHALAVAPGARRRGLAQNLMGEAAKWALKNGALEIAVLVTEANEAAQALYLGMGFEPASRYVYRERARRERTDESSK